MGILQKVSSFLGLEKSRQSQVKGFSYSGFGDSLDFEAKAAIDFFSSDPVVFGACNSMANWISSTDAEFVYTGRSSGKKILGFVNDWAKKVKFRSKLRNWALTHIIFDDVFVELDFDDSNFYILDSETMEVIYDEHGRIQYYKQNVNGKTVNIPSEKILHFKMNSAGSEILGITPLVPLYKVLKSKAITEEYSNVFFKRHATPRLVYKYPDEWSDDQIIRFSKMLKALGPHADLMIPQSVKVESVGSPMTDMQFEKWLKYHREQILVGMGLFPILLGLPEGSNKANSMVQFDAFRLRVRAVQNELETVINTDLLPKLLKVDNVEFRFKGISLEEYKKKADVLWQVSRAYSNLVKNNILDPEDAEKRFNKVVDGIE